jgi:hypothetical protein
MLSVFMLPVVIMSFSMFYVIMLSVFMLSVIMRSIATMSSIMLSVIMLSLFWSLRAESHMMIVDTQHKDISLC